MIDLRRILIKPSVSGSWKFNRVRVKAERERDKPTLQLKVRLEVKTGLPHLPLWHPARQGCPRPASSVSLTTHEYKCSAQITTATIHSGKMAKDSTIWELSHLENCQVLTICLKVVKSLLSTEYQVSTTKKEKKLRKSKCLSNYCSFLKRPSNENEPCNDNSLFGTHDDPSDPWPPKTRSQWWAPPPGQP